MGTNGHNWTQLGAPVRTFRGGSRIEEVSCTTNSGDYVFTRNLHTNGS